MKTLLQSRFIQLCCLCVTLFSVLLQWFGKTAEIQQNATYVGIICVVLFVVPFIVKVMMVFVKPARMDKNSWWWYRPYLFMGVAAMPASILQYSVSIVNLLLFIPIVIYIAVSGTRSSY